MVFEGLAEKYEDFIASLEDKGVPSPRVLVPLAIIAVIALAVFFLATPSLLAPAGKTVRVFVKNAVDGTPVARAGVTLYADDTRFGEALANVDGIAEFQRVPEKAVLSVSVSVTGFQRVSKQPLPADNTVSLSPEARTPASKTISVRVKDVEGNDVSGASVVIVFDDGTMKSVSSDSFGFAEVSVPLAEAPSHATINVEADGFEKKTRSVSGSEFDSTIFIELTRVTEPLTKTTEGTVRVNVVNEEFDPVSNALVSLIDYFTDAVLYNAKTSEDGSAAFEKITLGKKFRITVKHVDYEPHSSEDVYTLEEDSPTITVTLVKKSVPDPNALKIVVVDEENNPVGGATVTVYDRPTKTMLASETSDYSKGEAVFSAPKGKTLYVTAYADGFLPGFDELAQAGQTKKIVLVKEAAGNYFDVTIATLDKGEPAPNALVTLYNANGFPLGVPPAYTGADGTIVMRVPAKVKNAEYAFYATASLDLLKGKSDAATPSDDLMLSIALQPEPASLKVHAIDVSTSEPIEGAAVALTSGGDLITSCTTDAKGACEFAIAPDTEFVLTASAPGFLQATTSTQVLGAGEHKELNVTLYPTALTKNAFSRFLGLFDSRGKLVREASNAEYYTARFLVGVPKSSETTSFYVSVGDAASVEEDVIAVKSFDAGQTKTIYSGTQADESCVNEASNESETSDGLIKWVNFVLPKNFVGTREIALRVFVKPNAKAGDKLRLHHRVSGTINNVPFLSPSDEETLNALLDKTSSGVTLQPADFCGAKTTASEVSVTRDPLACDENGLCSKLVFSSDSQRARANAGFTVDLGKQFKLEYTLLNTGKETASLGIVFNENLEYLGHSATPETSVSQATPRAAQQEQLKKTSFQENEGNAGNAGENQFGEREERVSAVALPGEKVSGAFEFRALRASASTPVTLKVYYSEQEGSEPDALTNYVKISGKNSFHVTITPLSLVAGLRENARVNVLDSLNNPVTDAVVTFFECEGTPFNSQEIEVAGDGTRGKGEDGVYRTPVEATSIGLAGVRVSRPGFKTFESCTIEVLAGDFITVEPPSIKIEGDSSNPNTLTKILTVTSLLPVTSRVTTTVSCVPRSGVFTGTPIMVVPQSFSLRDSASVEVQPIENASANADCFIAFNARINEKNSFTAIALAQVKLTAPPTPLPACPTATPGYRCAPGNAPYNCVLQPQYSCGQGSAQSCFACDVGLHTLPNSINLRVSDTKPVDSFDKAIALDAPPEECRVEGFENNPQSLPQNAYNSIYGNTPLDYWSYQNNLWNVPSGYWSNPQFAYQQLYGYPSYYQTPYYGWVRGYPSGAYAGYDLAYQFPAFFGCPNALNYQTIAGSYYAQSYYNPWQQTSLFPTGYPSFCQYPFVCQPQYAQYCGFILFNQLWGGNQNFFNAYAGVSFGAGCQYPAICYNPQACGYGDFYYPGYWNQYPWYQQPFNYRQTKPPVRVRVDSCTQNDLQVTAEYTGNDYFYNSGMGGTQSGFIVVKTGPGQQKKIPVTVTVDSPVTQLPPSYPPLPFPPFPFPPTFPPYCWPSPYPQQCPIGYHVNGFCLPTQGGAASAEYNECGVPSEVRLYANKATGKARYQRDLQVPPFLQGATLLNKIVNKPSEGTLKVTTSGSKLTVDYQARKTGERNEYYVSDSATYNFYYPQAPFTGIQQQPAGTRQLGCNLEFVVEPDEFGELVVYTHKIPTVTAENEKDFLEKSLASGECILFKNKVRCFYSSSIDLTHAKYLKKGADANAFAFKLKDNGIDVIYSGDFNKAATTTLELTDTPDYNQRLIPVRVNPEATKDLLCGRETIYNKGYTLERVSLYKDNACKQPVLDELSELDAEALVTQSPESGIQNYKIYLTKVRNDKLKDALKKLKKDERITDKNIYVIPHVKTNKGEELSCDCFQIPFDNILDKEEPSETTTSVTGKQPQATLLVQPPPKMIKSFKVYDWRTKPGLTFMASIEVPGNVDVTKVVYYVLEDSTNTKVLSEQTPKQKNLINKKIGFLTPAVLKEQEFMKNKKKGDKLSFTLYVVNKNTNTTEFRNATYKIAWTTGKPAQPGELVVTPGGDAKEFKLKERESKRITVFSNGAKYEYDLFMDSLGIAGGIAYLRENGELCDCTQWFPGAPLNLALSEEFIICGGWSEIGGPYFRLKAVDKENDEYVGVINVKASTPFKPCPK